MANPTVYITNISLDYIKRRKKMRLQIFALMAVFLLFNIGAVFAENDTSDTDEVSDLSLTVDGEIEVIASPWEKDSKICIFMREWIQKGMFLVIWLVFLLGVATISGAAFPDWRNYGSKMILGSIGAMILYILGMQALKFFMGTNICDLGAF
jgi:hypothetical protein